MGFSSGPWTFYRWCGSCSFYAGTGKAEHWLWACTTCLHYDCTASPESDKGNPKEHGRLPWFLPSVLPSLPPFLFKLLLFFFSFVHLFVCLFYVYGCFSCMYVHVSHACLVSLRGQKKGSEALGLERDTGCFVPPCSSCESSLGPVERQPVFLTA